MFQPLKHEVILRIFTRTRNPFRINKRKKERKTFLAFSASEMEKFMESFSLFLYLCYNFATILLSISMYQHLVVEEKGKRDIKRNTNKMCYKMIFNYSKFVCVQLLIRIKSERQMEINYVAL